MNDLKPWMCPSKQHVLGQVIKNGNGVRQLLLYRNAVELTSSESTSKEVDIMAIIEGYVMDVRCDVCGKVRTWVPGEEALRQLLERWQKSHGE